MSDWQAEKGLKMQLTVLTEQHTETQEALKEKEKGVQQLQTQLKTAQGSFNQENKKLESQVSELQGAHARKVRRHTHTIPCFNSMFWTKCVYSRLRRRVV